VNLDRTQSARDLLDRAAAALDAAQLGEANAMVRLAIRENPDDPAARLLDAQIQLRRNLPEFAIVALDTRDQLDPDGAQRPEVALLRAEALMAAAFDDPAENLLCELAVVIPHDARPHRMLAGLYLKQGQYDPAAKHLRELSRIDPHDPAVRRLLAHVLASTDPRRAVELAMAAAPSASPDAARTLRTARMCRHTDRLRDAADLYAQLLREQPDDAALWLEAGELAVELGETDVAVKRFEYAAGLGHGHRATALDALALVHMQCGRFTAAAALWWQLGRAGINESRAWAGLWLCGSCAGRHTLARRARRRLVSRADASQRCAALAELWPHVATLGARDALAPVNGAASVLNELAAGSADTLRRVADTFPRRADVHFHHAVCAHLLGRRDAAAASLDAALRINPNYAAARHLRDLIEAPSGHAAPAAA